MTFLEKVCKQFSQLKIRYAVVGGHAVSLHGAVRGTVDIDFVLDWNKQALLNAEQALLNLGLVSRLPICANSVFDFREEYIENRNLIAWNFYNPKNLTEQVDIIINYDLSDREVKQVSIGNTKVIVLGLNDLIQMKKVAGRDQDLADIEALTRAQG